MDRKRFSTMLDVAVILFMVTAALVGGASAQGHAGQFKVLYSFTGGNDGSAPLGGLTIDTAGNLYGTTFSGGAYGQGTVFKLTLNSDGSRTESVIHSFAGGEDGSGPSVGLIFDAAGNLYGTTAYGGEGVGTVFKLTPNSYGSWTESVLYSFCSDSGCSDGSTPRASLILDAAGNLYGTTNYGGDPSWCGSSGCGVVFELKSNADGSWTESVIHTFTGYLNNDGAWPAAGLVFDAAGNLYGTTAAGGSHSAGTVFNLNPNADGSWSQSVLHSFTNGKDGSGPTTGLIMDASDNLYGTTRTGGTYGFGAAFKLKSTPGRTWTGYVFHQFTGGKDGFCPGGLVMDANGSVYGTAEYGGVYGHGATFRLKPNPSGGWTAYGLHQFSGGNDGGSPQPNVILDVSGNLYGTTYAGGTYGYGVVFEITSGTAE